MGAYTGNKLLGYRLGVGFPLAYIIEEIWRHWRAVVKVRERIERNKKFKPCRPSII